jgi:hypothetical protein
MQQNMSSSKYFLVMFFKTCDLCSFLEVEVAQPAWKTQAYSKDDKLREEIVMPTFLQLIQSVWLIQFCS